jgi:hypothetical protein
MHETDAIPERLMKKNVRVRKTVASGSLRLHTSVKSDVEDGGWRCVIARPGPHFSS